MNNIPLDILFAILAALLLLSAFFSGSETALMTLNRYRLQHLVKQKHKGAIKAFKLLQRPDRLMGLILLGNNFVNIMASSLATIIAIRLGGEQAILASTALLTLAVLIFSEVTPKTLAAIKPEILAYPAAWIYTPLLKLFYPFVWAVNLISNLLLRIVGINAAKHKQSTLNKDELKSIVSDTKDLMPARYQNMLLGILDLESASIEDIMTPRNEIVGLDLESPLESVIKQLQTSPHTILPVYKKSIDRIIGFLHLRSILSLINQPGFDKQSITDKLDKPFFIPESTPLHKQIQNFKAEKLRVGLVIDEYGDVQGLVTLDDLLQVIVGELITEEVADVHIEKDGSYIVDGSVTVRDLNRITQWALPIKGPKTLNGLIIEYMETIPKAGISLELHGYRLEIMKCDENTIKLVKFYPEK
ncbi:MAG: HlyC/CorC family transporter [Methylococcales symbiont of Hymedesmia sp. n. MRB-2018]|nr:MAG: HlyC/CorC family transporter [Methylococcales symbiont of Hymedesmia sp. n. MRB-2018]KAF3983947.1 MAG: HlyC/CorC family transporter [Methylococcales symbiont of Hymedesmia sp. n. MRB-2018]